MLPDIRAATAVRETGDQLLAPSHSVGFSVSAFNRGGVPMATLEQDIEAYNAMRVELERDHFNNG